MMAVTHIVPIYETPGHPPFSGAENHLLALLPALKRQGLDVELIVITPQVTPAMSGPLNRLQSEGVKITPVLYSLERRRRWLGSRNLEVLWRLRRVLASRRDRIIHIHLDMVVSFLAARLAGCTRVIASIHNDEPWLARPKWRAWLRLTDRIARHYIAITDHVRDYYAEVSGVRPDKLTTIYYGVELDGVQRDGKAILKELGLPPDRFLVGFVGRLSAQKNIPLLISAMEQMPDIQCAIIGDGELRQELETMVSAKQLSNIRFLGYQPNASDLIPAFDLLCLPSNYEGLGLVLVEAMLRRVPVVASRAGAMPEVLCQGEYGLLFEPGDLDGLIKSIRSVQAQPATMAGMVERAYTYAQEGFSVETMGRRTAEVYFATASRHPS